MQQQIKKLTGEHDCRWMKDRDTPLKACPPLHRGHKEAWLIPSALEGNRGPREYTNGLGLSVRSGVTMQSRCRPIGAET
jgi:hypothetical protein